MNSHAHSLLASKALLCALFIAVISFGQSSYFEATAQTGREAKSQASGSSEAAPPQTVVPLGNTGYLVPIPEIKMSRIIGDKSSLDSTRTRPKEPATATPAPTQELPAVEEMEPPLRLAEPPDAMPPDRSGVNRFSLERLHESPAVEQAPEPKPAKEAPEKEYQSPLSQSPVVPEDIIDAPAPKKEILGKKAQPIIPPLLDLEPMKRPLKATTLEAIKSREEAESTESIPLDPRREAETIPASEHDTPVGESPKDFREEEPTEPTPPPKALESSREPGPRGPTQELRGSEPALASVERHVPFAKEAIASPLAQDALNSPEVLAYLRETAPLIEELSLLMTRTPSLSLADYDPSDAEAAILRKEIYLKMDSMKRQLQNLDSKAFSIIPPPKYVTYHAVIRESITETLQACDAIISYLNERNDENLQKIIDHLTRVRELIRQTRIVQG